MAADPTPIAKRPHGHGCKRRSAGTATGVGTRLQGVSTVRLTTHADDGVGRAPAREHYAGCGNGNRNWASVPATLVGVGPWRSGC